MAVAARPEVHLGQRRQAVTGDHVDHQGEVDAPAADDRQGFEDRPASGVLPGQGLHDPGQVGEQPGDERAGDELGDPSPAGGASAGPAVEALHELDLRGREQRAEQAGHEPGPEVGDVAVDPGDEIAGGGGQRLPDGVALPGAGPGTGQDVGAVHHPGAGGGGHLGGAVGGVVVDDQDLVEQRDGLDQPAAGRLDDPADGGGLVPGRDTQRGGEAGLFLPAGEPAGVEVAMGEDGTGGMHGPESGISGGPRAL